jgi:hypothetical protein
MDLTPKVKQVVKEMISVHAENHTKPKKNSACGQNG